MDVLNYARGSRVRMLMYHSVSDTARDRDAVTPERFAAQMDYLASNGFRVIALAEACRLMEARGDLRRKIVLTFDDGYRDFLNAVPLLTAHGFPATLFVVTGLVGQNAQWHSTDKTRPLLTRAELEHVRAGGVTLGSHTVTHADLTALDELALADELARSREWLEEAGETFLPFAYPWGRFTKRERDAARRAGYDCAVIVGGRWGNGRETDRFALKREPMRADDTLEWFKKRVNGYYEWHYLMARLRGVNTR